MNAPFKPLLMEKVGAKVASKDHPTASVMAKDINIEMNNALTQL